MPAWDYLNAVILGVIQGIAEFLPISSSGHIVVANRLLAEVSGTALRDSFELNLALHAGTLLSILVVYRQDIGQLPSRRRLCVGIAAATLPLVVIGLVEPLREGVETLFESPLVAGFGLLATSLLLAVGCRSERDSHALDGISPLRALLIGLFQAGALVPGVSRSGSTISGGLISGLGREAATTFSFLVAIPAITGAAVLLAKKLLESDGGATPAAALLLAGAVSFLVGLVSLRWLLRLVSQRKLHWFAWYCALAGMATIIWQFASPTSGS